MRIVVSGGGTGGHILPALATCDALLSRDNELELLYVGQAGGMEAKVVAAHGLAFAAIRAGKFRRSYSAGLVQKLFNPRTLGPNVRDVAHVVAGVGGAWRILRRFRPDVVFIKGGYVGLPVGVAARLLGIPTVIHESDVAPGITNRILARWATKIAVGFPAKSYPGFEQARVVVTGIPVRPEIMTAHRLEGLAKFELDDRVPVLFVTGGSQGARQINDAVLRALPQLLEICQVVHLTGEAEYPRIAFELSRRENLTRAERYHVYGYLAGDMPLALVAADVVMARAGANTIAELAMLHKPTILIPNTDMAGHQIENARMLSRAGAVRVLDDAKLTIDRLVGEVSRLVGDRAEQERLGKALGEFAQPEAADKLAELILSVGGKQ